MKIKNDNTILDAIDWKILEALQRNARQTYTAIGESLGLAHSTVYDRIKRLEKHKVIERYTTVIDAEKAGARNTSAIMTVFTDPKESERIAEKLCESSKILEVYTSLSEELSIIAKVVAENQEELHEFIATSVAPLPGVSRIKTSIITKKFKETYFSVNNDDGKWKNE